MTSRVLRLLFVAYLAATAVHIGLVMAYEPFAFDAWNIAADTGAQPFSFRNWWEYGLSQYATSNPRLGQWFAYLAYKFDHFAVVATPLAYAALTLAITVLGLGRWPGGHHRAAGGAGPGKRTLGRDLALWAIAIGFPWFALPRIGMLMFCRAYGANYIYGAAIQLWFLIPLRLRPDGVAARGARLAYAAAGVLAGMCNEHTGPTLVVFLLGYAVWRQRTSGRRPGLAWAGAAGAAIGYAIIFFAPGQGSRYDGLANKVSLVGRLVQRGITNNLDIFEDWMMACTPLLGLLVIALVVARRDAPPAAERPSDPLRLVGLVLLAGTLITATVFVSPKLGPRFFLHGAALLLASFLAVADQALTTPRRLAPFVALAVAASFYAGFRSLPLYYRLHQASAERLAQLAAAPPGSVFTAEAFDQIEESWWFLGDDFKDIRKRELIAKYFGFRGVILRAGDIQAPLGVSDVVLVPRYQVTPASCLDERGGLDLGTYRGIDIASLHHAAEAAIERLRDRLARATPSGRLDRLDLTVGFSGDPPALPRPTLLVGRWLPTGFERYAGAIERRGRSTTRSITLPAGLAGTGVEVYIYNVGGEARRLGASTRPDQTTGFQYVPWARGTYWALACRPTECFVIAAGRIL